MYDACGFMRPNVDHHVGQYNIEDCDRVPFMKLRDRPARKRKG